MPVNVLVTGGAGFIGGHLAAACLRDGHRVTVLDALKPFYDIRLKQRTVAACRALGENGQYELVEGDVRDESTVEELVADCDVIFHQAARAGVRDSVAEPRAHHETNVDGTLNVLDAARETDVRRVVVASSSAVYGNHPENVPYDETDPTLPISPYGVSKLAAERYAVAYAEVYDLPAVALRYSTTFGPRMPPNTAVSNFVARCMVGRPPVVYGDGSQVRDLTYVDDVVRANHALLDTDAADGEVLNVASDDEVTVLELARAVCDRVDGDLSIEFGERHDADVQTSRTDVSLARERIDYEPAYTIEEGLDAYLEWYRENRDWYESLLLTD